MSAESSGASGRVRDEHYIIDLCDRVLGLQASRQHRFDFLRGDAGRNGRRRRLPVDAFYPGLSLVIEYRERQHTEAVAIMDRRMTVSGCSRGEQRRRYDERRRRVLPEQDLVLIELNVESFAHDRRKRLKREEAADVAVLMTYRKFRTIE
jgi:hypothetical protein